MLQLHPHDVLAALSPAHAAAACLVVGFMGLGGPREFVVTRDFVDILATTGRVHLMARRNFRFIAPISQCSQYDGRVVDGYDLGDLVQPGMHPKSEVEQLSRVLGIGPEYAHTLVLAMSVKRLCSEDPELWHLGAVVGAEVYDHQEWLEKFAKA